MDNDACIRDMWRYVSENIAKINWEDLCKDFFLKPPNYSSSGEIYKQIIGFFKNISPDISFVLKKGFIPILDQNVINKVKEREMIKTNYQVLCRYEIILSADGDVSNFPLVEKIYNISKNYSFLDDMLIIKFCPSYPVYDLKEPFRILFKDVEIDSKLIKYRMRMIWETSNNQNKIDLVFTIDDEFVKNHIKEQSDIELLRNNFFLFLESLLGEYVLGSHVSRMTVLPETAHNNHYPNEVQNLKLLSELSNDFKLYLPKFEECVYCHLNENHTEIRTIFENTESGVYKKNYCNYCYGCMLNLGMI